MATLDHLNPKYDPNRGTGRVGEARTVLACNECNRYRNILFLKTLPIEQRWAITNSPPTMLPYKDFFSTDYEVPFYNNGNSRVF